MRCAITLEKYFPCMLKRIFFVLLSSFLYPLGADNKFGLVAIRLRKMAIHGWFTPSLHEGQLLRLFVCFPVYQDPLFSVIMICSPGSKLLPFGVNCYDKGGKTIWQMPFFWMVHIVYNTLNFFSRPQILHNHPESQLQLCLVRPNICKVWQI